MTKHPVRSSLLFSPVAGTSNNSSNSDTLNNSPASASNSTVDDDVINPAADESDTKQQRHQRRRSDFRSKSTDQIIPNDNMNSSSSNHQVISSTTLYPTSTKFANLNVSQPAICPVPIPATRFDTITSYVDVIYQHQHQHQQQMQSQSQQNHDQLSTLIDGDDEDLEAQRDSRRSESYESDIVYLDPSDGIEGDKSFMATCPQCAMMVMTEFEQFPGRKSRKMALFLTPILMCWLPFYSLTGKKWMDVKHSCPKCQSPIAIYRK